MCICMCVLLCAALPVCVRPLWTPQSRCSCTRNPPGGWSRSLSRSGGAKQPLPSPVCVCMRVGPRQLPPSPSPPFPLPWPTFAHPHPTTSAHTPTRTCYTQALNTTIHTPHRGHRGTANRPYGEPPTQTLCPGPRPALPRTGLLVC